MFSDLITLPVVGPYMHTHFGVAGDAFNFFLPVMVVAAFKFLPNIGKQSVRARHILIKDEAKLQSIKLSIEGGTLTFEDAAQQFSTCPSGKKGGDLGKFAQGSMVPEFDAAVFSSTAEVNQLLGPIKTQFGWHLIRVDER